MRLRPSLALVMAQLIGLVLASNYNSRYAVYHQVSSIFLFMTSQSLFANA